MTYDSVQKFNSVENYILQMRPILRKRALFSDGTADYRMPPEPKAGDTVKIRFRTAADNVDLVVLCHEDEHIEMHLADCDRDFDYYVGGNTVSVRNSTNIILKSYPVCCAVPMTGQVYPEISGHSTSFASFRDFLRRSGQKVRLCIRFLPIASVTEIPPMT